MSDSFMDEMAEFIGEGIHKTLRMRGSRDSVAAWDCINKMGSDWGHIIDELTPMFIAKTLKAVAELLDHPSKACRHAYRRRYCTPCMDVLVTGLHEGRMPEENVDAVHTTRKTPRTIPPD